MPDERTPPRQRPSPQRQRPAAPAASSEPETPGTARSLMGIAAGRDRAPPENDAATGLASGVEEDGRMLGTVVVRNEFYRDGYRYLLRLSVILAVIIIGLVAAMFFVIQTHQPENRYFATTEDGRLIPMVPLSQANLSTPALMSWVAQSATEALTFGFNDYRRRLQESSRNFTRRGWDNFTQALQRSRLIEGMVTNQQVLTAVPRGAPLLISEGINQGRYEWRVQIPMVLTRQTGARTWSENMLVTLVIVRVSRLESPNGVGIEQWLAVAQ